MKFQHLPLGARFEFEGKVYVKAGPLTAAAENGSGPRLIPRHAQLKPVDGPMTMGDTDASSASRAARLRAAANQLVTRCTQLIESACAHTDPDLAAELMSELELERKRFEAKLEED